MSDLGVLFYYHWTRPHQLASLARRIEDSGATHAFSIEGFNDGIVPLAVMALATQRLVLGTSVVNLRFRHPYALAAEVASLADLAGDRLWLGIGPGHASINVHALGLDMDKPLSRTRDYATCVRAALQSGGDAIDVTTEHYQIRGAVIAWPPAHSIPILLAALRPRMVALAAQIAEGVILSNVPLSAIPAVRRVFDEGIAKHGRDPRKMKFCAIVNTILHSSRDEARRRLSEAYSASYLNLEYYQQALAGYGVQTANGRLKDADVDDLAMGGPPGHLRERIAAYREAGVDLPILAPMDLFDTRLDGVDLDASYGGLAQLAR